MYRKVSLQYPRDTFPERMCVTKLFVYTIVSNSDDPKFIQTIYSRLPRLPKKLIIVWKPPNWQTMSIDFASMIFTAFHHNGWSKVMHEVGIFSSVAWHFTYQSVEYIQLSSEDFKSMIGGIVILAVGKCVPMDTSWIFFYLFALYL